MDVETRYARSGDVNIAYQVVGNGPVDLVFVMGWVSNIDQFWTEPSFARFLRRLASFSRLIVLDKRGTGLSDRVPVERLPTLEERMDDVRAVMDAAGSERAVLVGVSEGGPLCLLFAATYPDRTASVVALSSYARRLRSADHPHGETPEGQAEMLERIPHEWGGSFGLAVRAPSAMEDEAFVQWWGRYLRSSASPSAAVALTRMNGQIDVREILPAIQVPVLVIHRSGDRAIPIASARVVAAGVAHGRFVELPGADHLPFVGDQDAVLDEIERFVTGGLPASRKDRVLLTVVRAELGTSGTDEAAEREIAAHRGRRVRTGETAILAVFDGPARAVRCASAMVGAARRGDRSARAAVHTGECVVAGDDISGVPIELTARMLGHAPPGEVLVSSTVRDLVAGSGLSFEDLRGVAGGLPRGISLLRLATAAQAPGPVAPAATAPVTELTGREREIAALVALGLTNRQIAEELVISRATVDRHVANILVKLGAHGRAQIAAWAVSEGLAAGRGTPRR